MKIALFFGSFNPVHVGHMIIASYVVQHTDVDQLWMIVSPHNPHKVKASLAKDHDRLHLVRLAIGDHEKLRASNIEFDLPKPSYTIETLTYLKEKHPNYNFNLIMGGDNLNSFHKWKNYEVILSRYELFVYPRLSPNKAITSFENHPKITKVLAPIMEISSTFIRNGIKDQKNIRPLLPQNVWQYLDEMNFYK